jgi:hypothetical protein
MSLVLLAFTVLLPTACPEPLCIFPAHLAAICAGPSPFPCSTKHPQPYSNPRFARGILTLVGETLLLRGVGLDVDNVTDTVVDEVGGQVGGTVVCLSRIRVYGICWRKESVGGDMEMVQVCGSTTKELGQLVLRGLRR